MHEENISPRKIGDYVIKKRKSLRKLQTQENFQKPEFWDQLFKEISLGGSLNAIAADRNVRWITLRDKIQSDPDLLQRYETAKNALGDQYGNRIGKLSEELEKENPYVAMKGYMWLASRLSPEDYGDKKQIKVEKNVSQMHIHELRDMRRERDKKNVTPPTEELSETNTDKRTDR